MLDTHNDRTLQIITVGGMVLLFRAPKRKNGDWNSIPETDVAKNTTTATHQKHIKCSFILNGKFSKDVPIIKFANILERVAGVCFFLSRFGNIWLDFQFPCTNAVFFPKGLLFWGSQTLIPGCSWRSLWLPSVASSASLPPGVSHTQELRAVYISCLLQGKKWLVKLLFWI